MPSRRVGSRAPHVHEPSGLTGFDADEVPPGPDRRESPRDPARVAAVIVLARALRDAGVSSTTPAGIAGGTAAGGTLGGVVVLEPWDAAWSGPVADVWAALARAEPGSGAELAPRLAGASPAGSWHGVVREAGDRRRDDRDEDEAAEALWRGRSVCAVSSSPDRHLPNALVRAADLRIAVGPPLPDELRELAEVVTGDKPSHEVSAADCASITPAVLKLARRAGQTADDYLRRVAALAGTGGAEAPVAGLDDLHGMEEAVAWGRDLAADLRAYRAGTLGWSAVDRGALLVGAPGTGKTTFARALARTCGAPLVAASYARWQASREGHLGDVLRAMAATFDEARRAAPCVLFIDELDSLHSRTGEARHRDWWTSVVNALLEHLDGLEAREGVVVLGATNHPSLVDPAIVRSGRLDRTIRIPLPDQAALAGILRAHLGRELTGADLGSVALHAAGATGADCERWVRGARRRARRASRPMLADDLLAEVRGSEEHRSKDYLGVVAVHEAGHALLLALERPGSLRHVSVVRGEISHGEVAASLADTPVDEPALGAILRHLLAGRAAEHVVAGRVTAGSGGPASSDLAQATRIALAAETALGFSDRPLLWRGLWEGDAVGPVLLGDARLAGRVNARLEAAWDGACATLRAHRAALDEIAGRLLARGALSGAEVEAIVTRHEAPRRPHDGTAPTEVPS